MIISLRNLHFFAKKQWESLLKKCNNIYNLFQNNSILRVSIALISLLFIGGVIFFFNIKSLIHLDDYNYSFVFTTFERINDFSDILRSQYIHYYEWGGRITVHLLLQCLLTLPPIIIDMLNTLVFIIFIIVLYYHVKGRNKHSLIVLLGMFFLTWMLQPVFGDTVFWVTGSVNYLWGTTIILSFLLPYRLYSGGKSSALKSCLSTLFCFIFGIIAGWTTENTGAAMIVMILLFIGYYKYNSWRIPVWAFSGLIGAIIGYTLMIAAPGNIARAGDAMVTPEKVLYNIFAASQSLFEYLGIFMLLSSILYIIYMKTTSSDRFKTSLFIFIYAIGTLVCIYSMIFSPAFPARSWFGVISIAIITFGIILYNLTSMYTPNRLIKLSFLFFTSFSFLFSLYAANKDVLAMYEQRMAREKAIFEAKAQGKKSVVLPNYRPKSRFSLLDGPYANKYMSQIYGIEIYFEE